MHKGCFMGEHRRYVAGQGRFDGHKLSDYGNNYVAARAIINAGGDCADEIAGQAVIFEKLIQDHRLI